MFEGQNLGMHQWVEGKIHFSSRERSLVKSCNLGSSYVYYECVSITQNFL
jgi:hypothetical protein